VTAGLSVCIEALEGVLLTRHLASSAGIDASPPAERGSRLLRCYGGRVNLFLHEREGTQAPQIIDAVSKQG